MLCIQADSSRRFRRKFDRANVHHPTGDGDGNIPSCAPSTNTKATATTATPAAAVQGLTLLHISACHEHFLRDALIGFIESQ